MAYQDEETDTVNDTVSNYQEYLTSSVKKQSEFRSAEDIRELGKTIAAAESMEELDALADEFDVARFEPQE